MTGLLSDERRVQAGRWLGELMVVVFGVLIALYAQQWASNRQSRQAAADAEVRIRDEIYANASNDAERIGLHRCLQERLRTIAKRLNAGADDWRDFAYDYSDNGLFLIRRVYRMPSRNWTDDAYRGALTSGALDSVAPERRAQWSRLYRQSMELHRLNNQEHELAPALNSLSLDGVVGPEDRRSLLQSVAELDRYNGLITLISRQNFNSMKQLGYRLDANERDEMQETLAATTPSPGNQNFTMMREIYGDCVDLSAFKLFDPALKTG